LSSSPKKLGKPGNLMLSGTTWTCKVLAYCLSFKSLDTPSRHFTSKMLHGWLNTGHQCAIITKDPLSSLCPCCQAPNKTYKHILHCTAPTAVKACNAVLKKITKLDERGSTTWRVFHQAIKNWLKDATQ
jgi:hypothetical protein